MNEKSVTIEDCIKHIEDMKKANEATDKFFEMFGIYEKHEEKNLKEKNEYQNKIYDKTIEYLKLLDKYLPVYPCKIIMNKK